MNPNPYLTERYRIESIVPQTENERTFRILYNGPVTPGQFFETGLPKAGESPFSISAIGDGYIDMTIRNVGKVTSALYSLKPGDWIYLRGPYGQGFDLDKFKGKPLVVAAGGIGLSPVKPLIDYFTTHQDEVPSFQVLLGFKSEEDILFKEDIKNWRPKCKLTLSLDRACVSPDWCIGLLPEFIKETKITPDTQVVIVGPPVMMKFTIMGFLDHGVPKENIWVSHERKMSCGLGICGHCKIDDTYICLDGPVFNYAQTLSMRD